MSHGKVSQAKRTLVELYLIQIDKRPGPGGLVDHITLEDSGSEDGKGRGPVEALVLALHAQEIGGQPSPLLQAEVA